jgi:hypothetical protein
VRRWINLALSPPMSRWRAYVKEKKRLVRAADKVLLRWQNMCLVPAWAMWEEQWREEKRMRRAAETVIRRWQNMRVAPALGGWIQAWQQRTREIAGRWQVLSLGLTVLGLENYGNHSEKYSF